MRLTLLVVPALILGACTTLPRTQATPIGATEPTTEPSVIFNVPMDPGQIRCSSLANPAALNAAVEWTVGQARAGVLAGRVAELPDESGLSQMFTAYCADNPNVSIRTAASQWGFAS